MKKIMLATSNAHKVEEFSVMLAPLGYEVMSLLDLEEPIEIEENGTSFEENALIKARAIHQLLGIEVLADDSGLAVNAMNGEPGIYSARFMGKEDMYIKFLNMFEKDDNIRKLENSIGSGDLTAAFEAAHTLKGVTANLGLTPLYNAVCNIVEPLRTKTDCDYSDMYKLIEAEYKKVGLLRERLKEGK